MSNVNNIIDKCVKSFREYIYSRPHRPCSQSNDVVVLSCIETKAIYSYKAEPPIIQIREDIYNSDIIDLVEECAYISLLKFTELTNKAKEQGLPYFRMNATHKKEAQAHAKQVMIDKYGEEVYYSTFKAERVKKAKSEKKEIKKTIKANKEIIKSMELPKSIDTKVDDILIKQVEEALKINNDFIEQKNLISEFDNEDVLYKDVEKKEITKAAVVVDEPAKMPFDIGLTDEERQEFVDDIFNDSFSLEDFLSDDLF